MEMIVLPLIRGWILASAILIVSGSWARGQSVGELILLWAGSYQGACTLTDYSTGVSREESLEVAISLSGSDAVRMVWSDEASSTLEGAPSLISETSLQMIIRRRTIQQEVRLERQGDTISGDGISTFRIQPDSSLTLLSTCSDVSAHRGDPVSVDPDRSGGGRLELRVYPNPASNRLTVSYSTASGPTRLELIDMLGRTVRLAADTKGLGGQRLLNVNVSSMPSGLYLLYLETNAQSASRMVLIAH
jgi:hypothetical protein